LLLLLLTMTLKQTFSHQHPQGHCMHPHIYCTGQLSLRSSKSNSAQLDRVDWPHLRGHQISQKQLLTLRLNSRQQAVRMSPGSCLSKLHLQLRQKLQLKLMTSLPLLLTLAAAVLHLLTSYGMLKRLLRPRLHQAACSLTQMHSRRRLTRLNLRHQQLSMTQNLCRRLVKPVAVQSQMVLTWQQLRNSPR